MMATSLNTTNNPSTAASLTALLDITE